MDSDQPPFRSLSREERRGRIVRAARWVMLEKGLDAASMDDVAVRAGTTKPTVYAHFNSKEELFSAVVELIQGRYLGKLREPSAYAADPIEAIALFCGRFLELVCWRDAVGYQRVTLASAARSPAIAKAVHETLHAEASRTLAAYLIARKLTDRPESYAELLLSATTGGQLIRHLFGVDNPFPDLPTNEEIGKQIDMKRIREAVGIITSNWEISSSH